MFRKIVVRPVARRALVAALMVLGAGVGARDAVAQSAFDVAVIRPSSGEVKFEHNGKTVVSYGTLRMHDVTVSTCIQWAYGITRPQIAGPDAIRTVHYDITAKTDPGATKEQMQAMMRTLLSDRFKVAFHVEKRELKVFTMTVAKGGIKMKPSAPGVEMAMNGLPSLRISVGLSVTRGRLPPSSTLGWPGQVTKVCRRLPKAMPVSPAMSAGSHAPLGVAE